MHLVLTANSGHRGYARRQAVRRAPVTLSLLRRDDERQFEPAIGYFEHASMHPALQLIGGLPLRRPVVRTRKTNEFISLDQVNPGKFCDIAPNSRLRQWAMLRSPRRPKRQATSQRCFETARALMSAT